MAFFFHSATADINWANTVGFQLRSYEICFANVKWAMFEPFWKHYCHLLLILLCPVSCFMCPKLFNLAAFLHVYLRDQGLILFRSHLHSLLRWSQSSNSTKTNSFPHGHVLNPYGYSGRHRNRVQPRSTFLFLRCEKYEVSCPFFILSICKSVKFHCYVVYAAYTIQSSLNFFEDIEMECELKSK